MGIEDVFDADEMADMVRNSIGFWMRHPYKKVPLPEGWVMVVSKTSEALPALPIRVPNLGLQYNACWAGLPQDRPWACCGRDGILPARHTCAGVDTVSCCLFHFMR